MNVWLGGEAAGEVAEAAAWGPCPGCSGSESFQDCQQEFYFLVI